MNEGRAERFKFIRERVHRHNQQNFEPTLGLAVEIARERHEGRRIGTLFISVDATVRYGGVSALQWKQYVKKGELSLVRAGINERRKQLAEVRQINREAKENWRTFKAQLRQLDQLLAGYDL